MVILGHVLLAFWFGVFTWFMWRLHRVSELRLTILQLIHNCSEEDLAGGRPWEWRFRTLNTVSFDRMLLQFWKPVRAETWWSDTSFMRPKGRSPEERIKLADAPIGPPN